MKQTSFSLALLTSLSVLTAACGGYPDLGFETPTTEGDGDGNGGKKPGSGGGSGTDPRALECRSDNVGRSYQLFDGSKLENSRINETFGANRARVKPYAALSGEFQRVLGVIPPSLGNAAGSFEAPPPRWFHDLVYSGVSLHAIASLAFEGCLEYTREGAAFAAAPDAELAQAECSNLMRRAWSRTPSEEEVQGCVDAALAFEEESEPRRKWAYVCTSVLSSTQFLTF